MVPGKLASLSGIAVFSNLSAEDQKRIGSLFTAKSFEPGDVILLQGEQGRGLHIIRSGRIKICIDDSQGNELIFVFLTKGDLLGEIAILDGQTRSATAIAVTQVGTYYLPREIFLNFLKSSPQACMDIIIYLCKSLRLSNNHLEEVSFLDVSGRVARNLLSIALKEDNPLTCNLSQEDLSNIVGASRVMVNKILNSFEDLGLIELTRNRIHILNEPELKRIGDYNQIK